jgi:hypothetical protein
VTNFANEDEASRAAQSTKTRIDVHGDPEHVLDKIRKELVRPPLARSPGRIGNEIFRNVVLVRLGRDDDDEPILIHYTISTLTELLTQRMTFYSIGRSGGERVMDPPALRVKEILEAPDVLDVPVVQQIVNAPVFGPKGELRTELGLLKEARVWYEPADGMMLAWPIPEAPTDEAIMLARGWIEEIFWDFPFDTLADRANAWALLLQQFVRPMIVGPTPLYVVEAPTAATGKSLLVTAATLPALGYELAAQLAPSSAEEWRKKLVSFLLKGKPVFFLDNIKTDTERLSVATLEAAVTQGSVEDRILGQSKQVTVPARCLWVVTVNNPRLSQEIARRGVQIRLDARMARPQSRTNFRHEQLTEWIREHRGHLVWSALTIIQAWVARGRPRPSPSVPAFGSFEAWREVLGGILNVIGYGDAFLGNASTFWSEHTDDESEDTCLALDHWWAHHADRNVTARELMHTVIIDPGGGVPVTVGDLLLDDDDGKLSPRGKTRNLGVRLKKLERKVLCNYRVESTHGRSNLTLYALRRDGAQKQDHG